MILRRQTSFASISLFLILLVSSLGQCGVNRGLDSPHFDAENDYEDGLSKRCTHHLVRQEWRTLSDAHKAEYIRAVKCTQSLPNVTSYHGVQSRFDDFQAVHIHTADSIHYVGHFLPWHRGFVSLYERTLRNDCDYRGALPYWDWTQDVAGNKSIRSSPLLDPQTGFGGDGVAGTYTVPPNAPESSLIRTKSYVGCVLDGPFAYNTTYPNSTNSFSVHLGPGKMVTTHCLVRGIDDRYAKYLSANVVSNALAQPSYERFRTVLEGASDPEDNAEAETRRAEDEKGGNKGENDDDRAKFEPSEHASGHLAIGGELGNLYSSPGDPLFFLHHANLDKIWWLWQTKNLESRLLDVSGSVLPEDLYIGDDSEPEIANAAESVTEQSPNIHDPEDEEEDEYNGIDTGQVSNATRVALDFQLRYGALGNEVPIKEVMDVTQFPLCYQYV